MSRYFCFLALFLTLSCARTPQQALWQCVEMDGDSSLTVNDSIARIAYNYYSRHGSARSRMMATYYLGQAEYDAGKSLPATLHFKQAYDLAAQLDDPSYMGFSCQRLSRLYAQNFDNNLSVHYARLAIPLLENCGDTLSADFSRIDLAERYLAKGDYSIAENIIDSLLAIQPRHLLLGYYTSLVKGNIRFFQNDYDAAKLYYNRLASLSPLTPILYGRLALIAEHQGKQRQADSLLKVAWDNMSTDYMDSVNYHANRADIALMRKDFETAYNHQSIAYGIQDSCFNQILARSITHSLQTYFEQEFEAEKSKRKDLGIIFLLLTLILLSVIGAGVIALRRRREQIVEQMAQMETLSRELLHMQQGHVGAQAVISSLVQDRINTMSQLADTYLSWSDEAVSLREVQYGKTFKEDIISEFRKELRRFRDDEHFIPSIEEALNHSHNGIISRIRQDCQGVRNGEIRINEKDFQLLVLFFANFSNSSVAFLLDMTDNAVRTRKKNLRKVLLSLENGHAEEYLAMLSGKQHKTATNR